MRTFWPTTPPRLWWHYAWATPALLAFLWWPFIRGTRVPVLGWVDLAIHEFGHAATIWLPTVLNLAMGSGVQVGLPLAIAAGLWWRSADPLGAGLALGWAGTSAQDASVYIGDATTQALPLIGGVHDWGTLLGPQHLDALWVAEPLARLTWTTGLLLVLAGGGMIAHHGWAAWMARDDDRPTGWTSDAARDDDRPTGWTIDPARATPPPARATPPAARPTLPPSRPPLSDMTADDPWRWAPPPDGPQTG